MNVSLLLILSSTTHSLLETKALQIYSLLKVTSAFMARIRMQKSKRMFTAVPQVSLLEIQPVKLLDFCLK